MLCKQCNTKVEDDCLICPSCQSSVAFLNQKEIVTKIKDNTRNDIAGIFKSKAFLIFAIGLTLVFFTHIAFSLPLAFKKETLGPMTIILLLICVGCTIPPLLSAISAWNLFTHTKGNFQPTKIRGLKKFPAFWQTVLTILKVIVIIFEVLLSIVVTFLLIMQLSLRKGLNDAQSTIESSSEYTSQIASSFNGFADKILDLSGGIILILIIVLIAIIIFFHYFFKLCKSTYASINYNFDKLEKAYASGNVNLENYIPKHKLYTLSIMFILLCGSLFAGGALEVSGLLGFGGMMLANGIYLILCSIFFSHADIVQKNHDLIYQTENNKLIEINKKTIAFKNEKMRLEREAQYKLEQEQRARDEERARLQRERDEEKERSREFTQEMLLQQMMLMMQQNMQNGTINTNTSTPNPQPSSNKEDKTSK